MRKPALPEPQSPPARRLRTMALLLVFASMPALGAIRSDQALAPVVVYGAAPPRQDWARVASDGTNFFAVWRTPTSTSYSSFVIGGGRISPDGELLDRPSILFASNAEVGARIGPPDVVFVGGNFLVAYQSGTSLITRRFSREGRPLDSQPNTIGNMGMFGPLSTNGRSVLLVTAQNRFRFLASDGTLLGPEREIPNAGYGAISVASNGDGYLIAYATSASIFGDGTYVVIDANGLTMASKSMQGGNRLATASNGSGFLIVIATFSGVSCQFVDEHTVIGVVRPIAEGYAGAVFATWSGSDFTIVWSGDHGFARATVATRVDAKGVLLDPSPVAITPLQAGHWPIAFASASNGHDTLVVAGDYDGSRNEPRTTAAIFRSPSQIDAEPPNRRHAAIASSAVEQASSSIASNGSLSLVTWRETISLDRAVVRAAFIAADGQLGAPIDLGDGSLQTATATASNGRDFFVTYVDGQSRLVARRVTLEGVLDSTPIVITPFGLTAASIAARWSGEAYIVATTGATAVTITGVAPDGRVTAARQVIETDHAADSPAVSCGASGCSVTWHRADSACFFPDCSSRIENDLIARTSVLGNVLSQIVLTSDFGVTPALSLAGSDGRSVFVYSAGKNTFAGRITDSGVVVDTPAINGGRRIMTSATSFPLQPIAVVGNGLYFAELDSQMTGRLYWTRIEAEPSPHTTFLIDLHQSVRFNFNFGSYTPPLEGTLTASARNAYLVYSQGEEDETLMAPRLFLRTLASPELQTASIRRHAAR